MNFKSINRLGSMKERSWLWMHSVKIPDIVQLNKVLIYLCLFLKWSNLASWIRNGLVDFLYLEEIQIMKIYSKLKTSQFIWEIVASTPALWNISFVSFVFLVNKYSQATFPDLALKKKNPSYMSDYKKKCLGHMPYLPINHTWELVGNYRRFVDFMIRRHSRKS